MNNVNHESNDAESKVNRLREMEGRYGMSFRMAMTHLFDVGHKHITPESVGVTKQAIMAEKESQNGIPIMTKGFKCQIMDITLELAQFSIWDLLYYVKHKMYIG